MELLFIVPPPPTIPPPFTNIHIHYTQIYIHTYIHTQIVNPLAATPYNP